LSIGKPDIDKNFVDKLFSACYHVNHELE